ncbi:hypothetical protein BT96DRAFT_673871 [Gymnopus androsaceus JB14]|uniref:Uncharacterized protein n=1 Tax=Gymnopus androsaceus JB14 TaxID=1447944 RepID=A0A6A4HNH4_9AGAR|nr:hypothetical protein BT96DRAFT_673871 [Gymnopus androsaceus JB14]
MEINALIYTHSKARNGVLLHLQHYAGSICKASARTVPTARFVMIKVPPSSVSPRPGSANSLATDISSQLSPLKNLNMLQMRSMPTSPSASPRPASSASLRVPAQTSDASVSEVSSSVDTDAGDRQETSENHVTGNWETMDNDAIPSADASASTENATSDMGQDTSSYHGNWETMDDTVRAPDVPANSINESEEFRHDEPPSASVNPPPTGFPPPFMMYAQPYYDPNLYAPASQSTQNNAPHPYHSYASSFATVSGDVSTVSTAFCLRFLSSWSCMSV